MGTSKYPEGIEIQDSEDDLSTSSPNQEAESQLDMITKTVGVPESLVGVTHAEPAPPPVEGVSDVNSIVQLEDEDMLDDPISTNNQSFLSCITQESITPRAPKNQIQSIPETSAIVPTDEKNLDSASATQSQYQETISEPMPSNDQFVISPIVEESTAQNKMVTEEEAIAQEEPSDTTPTSLSAVTTSVREESAVLDVPTAHGEAYSKAQPSEPNPPSPASERIPQKPTTKSLKTNPNTTLADLTAQRATLLKSFAALPTISPLLQPTLTPTSGSTDADSPPPSPTDVMPIAKDLINTHIKLLHTYNEIKDIGQGLMGLLADQRGVQIKEVQEEFGVGGKD